MQSPTLLELEVGWFFFPDRQAVKAILFTEMLKINALPFHDLAQR